MYIYSTYIQYTIYIHVWENTITMYYNKRVFVVPLPLDRPEWPGRTVPLLLKLDSALPIKWQRPMYMYIPMKRLRVYSASQIESHITFL